LKWQPFSFATPFWFTFFLVQKIIELLPSPANMPTVGRFESDAFWNLVNTEIQVRSLSFRPKIAETLKNYSTADFRHDLVAGLTVGVVALPLAMALAIASGLKPEIGLFTAVIGGFLISAFGGSRVQIGGPAGAFVPLLAPIVIAHGPQGLAVCALVAGLILIALGLAKMGTLIKFIPYPVVTGFTSGIAIIILSTQLRDFFGLETKLPPDFVGKCATFLKNFSPNWPTVALSVFATIAIWFWPKKLGRFLPGSIVVIIAGAILSAAFHLNEKFGIQTLGTQFGAMPQAFPAPHWPTLPFDEWRALLPSALTVAVLGAIESLLCAVVADGMIDDRHDSNQELVGQGIANIVSGVFGGMPVTGVLARTATNIRNGARTPVAGIVHAITLLVILLLAAPLTRHIPLAALSAVLTVVALRMGEWHQFVRLNHWPRSDVAVFLCAFILTIAVDLPVAVGTSLVLASALLVKRLSETTRVSADEEVTHAESPDQTTTGKVVPKGVMVFRVFGAFFFGAADKLETSLRRAGGLPDVLILRMRDVLAIDATGLDALEDLLEKLRQRRKDLILCGPHSQPMFALTRAGLIDKIGLENVCADMDTSLARARQILATKA
jgi:SulP family sulfate permease